VHQTVLYLICALAVGQLFVLHYLEGSHLDSQRASRAVWDADAKERLALQIRVNAAQLQMKAVDQIEAEIGELTARTKAGTEVVRPQTLSQATHLKNASHEAYAQLQEDLKKMQILEEKLVRATTHEQIEADVSAALAQDQAAPQGRAIPVLGPASEWLSTVHRLTDSGQVRGCVRVVELIVRLLALPPSVHVEIAPGGPQAGDGFWDDPASGGGSGRGGGGGGGGGKGGASPAAVISAGLGGGRSGGLPAGGETAEAPYPDSLSAAMVPFLREHRLWRASRVRHVHLKPRALLPAALQKRCRGRGSVREMCRRSVAPHNIMEILSARGLERGKSTGVLSAHTGTSDIYLLRAVLQGGVFPAVITVAYNRNFAAHDAYAVVPELAGAVSECPQKHYAMPQINP